MNEMSSIMKILFLAAEAEPFIKVGGLADVAGSLPLALRRLPPQATRGVSLDVRLVLPFHRAIFPYLPKLNLIAEFSVNRLGGNQPVKVFELILDGMPVNFIYNDQICMAPSVYSTDPALDREKYAFFSLAAIELTRTIDWQPDVVHANDWHTALALYTLRSRDSVNKLHGVRTVLTVHNLPYMGGESLDVLSAYDLPPLDENYLPKWAQTQPLPLGLWSADAIIPVSPTYAQEIMTPGFGCGLESFLETRKERITGILNGLDVNCWNPETDKNLSATFNADKLSARGANKNSLQKVLDLREDDRIPLLVMVGRVDQQKGLDITFEALHLLSEQKWQFAILGTGNPLLENEARSLQVKFPDRARAIIRYDEALGRLFYGGADMLLMPSRYEPCGLAQMIAMRYGCVPLVHATGGLKDTVVEDKTGYLFSDALAGSMAETMVRALSDYVKGEKWQLFQQAGMKQDFSWSNSARQYADVYLSKNPSS
jgi:starch synthase